MEVRIGRIGGPPGPGPGRKRSAAGSGFGGLLAPAAEDPAPAEPLGAAHSPLPVLPPAPEDAAARAHGGRALGALRDIQLALLAGEGGAAARAALARLAQSWPDAADPALQAVLQEIRVRAAVEQARCD